MIKRIRQALIFAAGRGERMRPLTSNAPKPLLVVGGKRLIEWHLEKLACAGFENVVINIAYLSEQFRPLLGDGARFGLNITYSNEGAEPLETGGGMLHALQYLRDEPFALVNGDIWCDLDFSLFQQMPKKLAHLWMVAKPSWSARADFYLDSNGLLCVDRVPNATYAGLGIFSPAILSHWRDIVGSSVQFIENRPRFKLAPILDSAMQKEFVTGEMFTGHWTDVGTPQRLAELDRWLKSIDSAASLA